MVRACSVRVGRVIMVHRGTDGSYVSQEHGEGEGIAIVVAVAAAVDVGVAE